MRLTKLSFALATAGTALVSAFPADFEADNAVDILTGRAIGSACSTPVYRSFKTLCLLLVLTSHCRMDLGHASKPLAAQQTASAWQDTVPTTQAAWNVAFRRPVAPLPALVSARVHPVLAVAVSFLAPVPARPASR